MFLWEQHCYVPQKIALSGAALNRVIGPELCSITETRRPKATNFTLLDNKATTDVQPMRTQTKTPRNFAFAHIDASL